MVQFRKWHESDLPQGAEDGQEDGGMAAAIARHLADYEKEWRAFRVEAGLAESVSAQALLQHGAVPSGTECKDYHRQCTQWADSVSITLCTVYMLLLFSAVLKWDFLGLWHDSNK